MERQSCEASLPMVATKWKNSASRPMCGLFRCFTEDLELTLMQYLSAKDLANLYGTSKAFREFASLVCSERLKFLLGRSGEEVDLETLPMVRQFLKARKTSLPRLLHVVAHCREQTYQTGLSCGQGHTCVTKKIAPGRTAVFTFGDGSDGQLGTGESENSVLPVRVNVDKLLAKSGSVISVACGAQHTALLTDDGRLISFGLNTAGQLGDGTRVSRSTPAFVKERFHKDGSPIRYKHVVAGRFYTAALTEKGRVAIFGEGLEVDDLIAGFMLRLGDISPDEKVKQMAAGQEHLLLLTDQNKLYAVGSGHQGKLGLARNLVEAPEERALEPNLRRVVRTAALNRGARAPGKVAVANPSEKIVQIAAGGNHSAYVTADGHLYTWGGCTSGELGLGKFIRSIPKPTRVTLPTATPFALNVSCGKAHTAVLTTCGRIVTFGSSAFKQDGKRHKFWATTTPQEIFLGELAGHNEDITFVVCGGRHSAVMDVNSELFSFGDPLACGRTLRMSAAGSGFMPRRVPINEDASGFRLHSF